MPATVEICESNGAAETITHNITNTNMGDVDSSNLDPTTYPITPGENSFEKWQRIHVTAMGGSAAIKTLKIWRTGSLGSGASHKTNAREAGYTQASYATPTKSTSTVATQTMPTTEPSGPNLGIGGSLTGQLTAPGYSDYLVHQLQTTGEATSGTTTTMNYKYTEVA